ncbi:uncharacterized protein VDAG_00296 [Verticillium dahliae VdLs.17]|uniref:Integral membrane protein n=1 Tax=Verticillium dahliae (strain VdLs.17 / ATCC MYA-4575 / FGSC 10137) TaxID=498257 RepID=G2WRW3_VERDV|nr:uncharacterized protein VDAG_00296 [Verticillium dahliae VdLs.17]EGY13614.1 integral membrane protein [Verticillium dahliae VdLs.17]KAF3344323.1 60S ribosomal protein L24 [Verticillium dahliae VDG2]KAH6710067.1 integral membrane protein [Verticillium dahliae]
MLTHRLGLLSLLVSSVSASYVQYQLCDPASSRVPVPPPQQQLPGISSLSASIETADDGHQHLAWVIDLLIGDEHHCDRQVSNVTVDFTVETLTGTARYEHHVLTTCKPVHQGRYTMVNASSTLVTQDLGRLSPLSTFHSDIYLASAATGDGLVCLQANITPALRPTVSSTLRWAPFGLFLFILAVGILRSCFDRPIRLTADDESDEEARSARPVLPHVGDCLQYLQFIFLTGSLSLWYPGFYRPAVSMLNWYSLFLTGPITHGHVYPGSADGIFEINGTYVGTHGFDLMHQIVGTPATMTTWTNLVIAMVVVVASAAALLECTRLAAPRIGETDMAAQAIVMNHGFQHRVNRVLRVVLSYFTMPLIALSCYQITYAALLPGYHTSLAVLLIVIIIAAFAWLVRQIPARSLGLLVFDSKRYQQVSASTSSDQHGKAFIVVLFVLAFIRGAAVGGLQITPLVQLPMLIACELVLLACILGFQAYPAWSVGTISALSRVVTLALMVAFVPGVADIHVKSAIGYAILLIHSTMLFCGFLGPAVYHLVVLCARHLNASRPEVYGLRELRRRQVSRTDLNRAYVDSPSPAGPDANISGARTPLSNRTLGRPTSTNTQRLETPQMPASHYFRSPRPSSVRSKDSVDLRSKVGSTTQTVSSSSSRGPPRAISPLVNTSVTFGAIVEPKNEYDTVSTLRSSESSSSSSFSADGSPSSRGESQGRPLGPRWNDYSFRESDLYYMVPQPGAPQAAIATEQLTESAVVLPTIRSVSSSFWTKLTGQGAPPTAEERGFKVVRPNNGLQRPSEPTRPPNSSAPPGAPR